MGTGKTTVGRCLAAKLQRCFVDTDAEIARSVGLPIVEIFARQGESGFRRMENEVCLSLASRHHLVIATGGGTLLNPENYHLLASSGVVVCLQASLASVRQRLANSTERPLAQGDWEGLWAQRKKIYAQIHYQVETTDKTPEEVAQEIIGLVQPGVNG